MHAPAQTATCHVCGKTFKNAEYRNVHRAKEHGITQRMMKRQQNESHFSTPASPADVLMVTLPVTKKEYSEY